MGENEQNPDQCKLPSRAFPAMEIGPRKGNSGTPGLHSESPKSSAMGRAEFRKPPQCQHLGMCESKIVENTLKLRRRDPLDDLRAEILPRSPIPTSQMVGRRSICVAKKSDLTSLGLPAELAHPWARDQGQGPCALGPRPQGSFL